MADKFYETMLSLPRTCTKQEWKEWFNRTKHGTDRSIPLHRVTDFFYTRKLYKGKNYVVFVKNSNYYLYRYETIIMNRRTKEIISKVYDESLQGANVTALVWCCERTTQESPDSPTWTFNS